MQKYIYVILTLSLAFATSVPARQTTVTGSVHTGLDYWERSYDEDTEEKDNSDDGDKKEIGIGPDITIVSEGIRDSVSFRYAPLLKYDDTEDETDIEHYLSLAAERMLNRKWSVSVSDDYRLSDDPYFSATEFADISSVSTEDSNSDETSSDQNEADQTEPDTSRTHTDELSKDGGRSRYWTNNLSLQTQYSFAESTSLNFGYTFAVLRNDSSDEDAYDEYDRHTLSANLSYAFSRKWTTRLGGDYTRGLYDDVLDPEDPEGLAMISDDLDSYGLDYRLAYEPSGTDLYPLDYNFVTTQYENENRRDTFAHNMSMGWEHAFDQRTQMRVGGGPSYAEAEDLDGEWGYNAYFDLSRSYEHAQISLSLDKRYDTQNFTGSTDAGLKDAFTAQLRYTQQVTQSLDANVYGRYRWESNLDPQDEYLETVDENEVAVEDSTGDVVYDKNSYELGAGLNYAFLRYYSAGLKYAYYISDGDLSSDQYNDHRVMLTLTATKNLWRW